MAQQAASITRVLAPHLAAGTLKVSKQRKRHYPADSDDEEPQTFVHSLREHMTTGGKENKRYEEAQVFDCSEGMVLPCWDRQLESGLLGAIKLAYAGRYCLNLRPDDLWLAISQGVSAHLQSGKNAEKYRKTFVEHEGKKDIVVDVTEFLTGT